MPANKVRVKATWWKEEGPENASDQETEIEMLYEGDTFYIDGLRDGHYLSLDLSAIAKAITANAASGG